MTHAALSPGSRSTPLVFSLARDGRVTCSSHIDERAGAFHALGAAKATGRPAVLACTSGTAAANYAPAVIEAYEARVGLLVLTADRPPELRDVGAGQTIDQVKLYGRAAKWFLEVDDAPATEARMRFMRALACRAFATAISGRPGPVHLNFSLREPLVLDEDLPPEPGGGGRRGGDLGRAVDLPARNPPTNVTRSARTGTSAIAASCIVRYGKSSLDSEDGVAAAARRATPAPRARSTTTRRSRPRSGPSHQPAPSGAATRGRGCRTRSR